MSHASNNSLLLLMEGCGSEYVILMKRNTVGKMFNGFAEYGGEIRMASQL